MSIGIDKLNPTYIHLRVRAQNSIGQGLDPELTSLDNARPKTGNDNIIAGNAHLSQSGNGEQQESIGAKALQLDLTLLASCITRPEANFDL